MIHFQGCEKKIVKNCLLRVTDCNDSTLTPNKRTTYHNLTRNPGKRRCGAKKEYYLVNLSQHQA